MSYETWKSLSAITSVMIVVVPIVLAVFVYIRTRRRRDGGPGRPILWAFTTAFFSFIGAVAIWGIGFQEAYPGYAARWNAERGQDGPGSEDHQYRGPYADAVEECVAKVAGWPGNDDNTRGEFLALFDPSRASVEELQRWEDGGRLWPHVRVRIPRIAEGYYERRHTRRPIEGDASCSMFRRRDVWITTYG